MVTEYVPAINPVAVAVVLPFDHKYVYGVVPPDGDTDNTPVALPLQAIFVWDVAATKAVGCVMVKLLEI